MIIFDDCHNHDDHDDHNNLDDNDANNDNDDNEDHDMKIITAWSVRQEAKCQYSWLGMR